MLNRLLVITAALAGTVALPALAQAPAKAGAGKPYTLKRMPDGHPDLQGTYDLATMTPMDRPNGAGPTMTEEQAKKLETANALRKEKADQAISGDRQAPPVGGDGSPGAAGNVGGYNQFWLDPGSRFDRVNGEIRTSIIVHPPNGRVPPMLASARTRNASLTARPTSDA